MVTPRGEEKGVEGSKKAACFKWLVVCKQYRHVCIPLHQVITRLLACLLIVLLFSV